MTTVVVPADPSGSDVLDGFEEILSSEESTALYRAMFLDVCELVQHGEADLLVNYAEPDGVDNPKTHLNELLQSEISRPEEIRYEPQVGSTRSARVGNALTHLLDAESTKTVAVIEPTAVFLRREHIGTMAMKLRTSDAVAGPAPGGRLTVLGLTEPIDFTDIYTPPAVETVTERAVSEGLDVDFLAMTPLLERAADLPTAVSLLAARRTAGQAVPPRTTARLEEWGFQVEADGTVSRSFETQSETVSK